MSQGPRLSPRMATAALAALAVSPGAASAAPGWTPQTALTAGTTELIHSQLSASTLAGTRPWITWQRNEASTFFGLMGTTIDGGSLTTAGLDLGVATPHTFNNQAAQTIGLPNGDGLAAWADASGPTLRIAVAEFDGAANAWRTPRTLNPYDAATPGFPAAETAPQLSADAQGNVALAYVNTTAVAQGRALSSAPLLLRTRTPNGTWSEPMEIPATPTSTRAWRVSALTDGRIVALWQQDLAPSGNSALVSAVRGADGAWSTPVAVSDPATSIVISETGLLRVASDSAGNAVAAWIDAIDRVGYAADLAAGAVSWSTPQTTSSDNGSRFSRSGARNMALAINDQGDAAVAWGAPNNAPLSVATRRSRGAWVTPAVQPDIDRLGAAPPLVVQPDGAVIVVAPLWNDTVAAFRKAADQTEFSAALPLGPAGERLDRSTAGQLVGTNDRDGSLTVAWAGNGPIDAPAITLRTSTYDQSGPVHSPISIPETATIDVPALMSVQARDVASGTGETNWAFGDGKGSVGRSARHSYQLPGTYTVTATTKDTLGNARVTTRQIAVRGAECGADRQGTTITVRCNLGFDPGTRVKVNGRIQRVKRNGKVGVSRDRTRTTTSTGAFTLQFRVRAARRGLYAVTIAPRGLTKQIVRVRVS